MSQQITPEPIDPAALALLADGSMTVRQAAEWSGISRSELFALMHGGHVEWFRRGKNNLIPRRSLNEYLARLYAAHRVAPIRKPSPRRAAGAGTRTVARD
ncbi:unnamed protein product [Gemmata massiliana]|uniref:Helix-turn-helix domain-containing protein n=1 Tax=Gemmata massiliana TaxID=1210884 RepID=A0A6P2DAD4_9BACT|nr:hypothetical protein [Gemmata massiliana]VTR97847.1 unnamed protein product [Gemmata massiliana]